MSDSYVPFAVQIASWAPLTAFAASLFIVWWLATGRFSAAILDRPKSRSLHEIPVPRTGGLGLHAGFLVALGLIAPGLPVALWIAFAMLLLISFFDDIRGVAPAWRLLVHIGASGLFAATVLGSYGLLVIVAATILCAWMANLYNFMDGSDGLAGGMAVVGFSFYGAAACLSGNVEFALVNFSIAAAALGFLVFNFHPARIFLGDVGSVPLGFLAAALGVLGWLQRDWSGWYPALVFGPFIADASVTLARRILRMEKIWQAHRDHYYQRLVRMGWGHRKTALAEYAVMAVSGAVALAGLTLPAAGQSAMLAAVALAYLSLIVLIELRWQRYQAQNPS
jgi:UDP-N-acetylmuramyl pentapeptide phosphotransferase/UDP-N-acetylglucosamine-1-phosphate transferase